MGGKEVWSTVLKVSASNAQDQSLVFFVYSSDYVPSFIDNRVFYISVSIPNQISTR